MIAEEELTLDAVWPPPPSPAPIDFPALLREAAPPSPYLTQSKALPPPPPQALASYPTPQVPVGGGVRGPVVGPPPPPRSLPNGPRDLRQDRTVADAVDDQFAQRVAEAVERIVPASGRMLEPHQIPPRIHDDPASPVKGWVMMAGRNAGKSFAGARWLHRMCNNPGRPKRCRIIAPSFGDAVASCVEGPSGVLEASGGQAVWKPSHPGGAQVQWPNGSVCYVIGTPTPRDVDRLRAIGNIDYDWFEEAAANPQLHEAERQARLSRRRLGSKWICTTTPRPLPEVRQWKKDSEAPIPTVAISEATAFDNPYADPLWLEELETMYAGTLLYQQEVLGKVLEDVAGAIWNAARIERSRITVPSGSTVFETLDALGYKIIRTAVGVDPANSSGLTGIVAVALCELPNAFNPILGRSTRHLMVLEDASTPGMSAEAWAAEAVRLALKYDAPIIAENDSGGDAIRAVLKAADHLDRVTVIPARARGRGSKQVRAEPIALLWERDDFRGHIVGVHGLLEEQMTTWVPDDKATAGPTGSPDRVDALVWACTFLWTTSGAGDIEVHLPAHMRNQTGDIDPREAREAILHPRPGTMAPWARSSRHRKNRARK
jgi:phage terminase large subunit-like protein